MCRRAWVFVDALQRSWANLSIFLSGLTLSYIIIENADARDTAAPRCFVVFGWLTLGAWFFAVLCVWVVQLVFDSFLMFFNAWHTQFESDSRVPLVVF